MATVKEIDMSIGSVSGGQADYSAMRAKMDAKMSEMFAEDDTDGSGGLSLEEFSAAHEAREAEGPGGSEAASGAEKLSAEEMFAEMDEDGDGQVTEEEMVASRPPPPHGNFSDDTLTSLLAAQEESQEDSVSSILSAALETSEEDSSEDDLISELLEEAA